MLVPKWLLLAGVAAVVAATALSINHLQRRHVVTYGHRIPYGWHVDIGTVTVDPRSSAPYAHPSGGIVVPEEGQWGRVLNFSFVPGIVESCMSGTTPVFAATAEKFDQDTGKWTRFPQTPMCLNLPIRPRLIWPLQSFSTRPIPLSKLEWFQSGDFVRLVVLSKWGEAATHGRAFASKPFRLRDTVGDHSR